MVNDTKQNPTDCLECRLVSGFGIIAIGCYLFSQAHKRKKFEANVIRVISAGAVSAGIARLFNIPFYRKSQKTEKIEDKS